MLRFFPECLIRVTAFRMGHRYMFLTLPLGGLLIVLRIRRFHFENNGGTDSVIESIHSEDHDSVPDGAADFQFHHYYDSVRWLCGGA